MTKLHCQSAPQSHGPAATGRQRDTMKTPGFLQIHRVGDAVPAHEAAEGLRATRAHVWPKFFHDAPGSRLFDASTELPECYPTRSEARILAQNGAASADAVLRGAGCTGVRRWTEMQRRFGVFLATGRVQRALACNAQLRRPAGWNPPMWPGAHGGGSSSARCGSASPGGAASCAAKLAGVSRRRCCSACIRAAASSWRARRAGAPGPGGRARLGCTGQRARLGRR